MKKHLYEIFADKWYRGGSIWIYSDPHFGDDEMKHLRKDYIGDDEQVRRINKKVGKNDTIIFLGDIGDVNYIRKIKGYKVLIMGNHDKGVTNYRREVNTVEKFSNENMTAEDATLLNMYTMAAINGDKQAFRKANTYVLSKYTTVETVDNKLFDEVYEGPLMINDKIILSHEPIENLPPYMFNIHGHDHSNWEGGNPNRMNMCAEFIDYTPVNLKSIIEGGKLKDVPSIHRVAIDRAIKRKSK